MDFNLFQQEAYKTAVYPRDVALAYVSLGLTSEAGEVAGLVKKMYRDDGGNLTEVRKQQIIAETSDVLWYCAALCTELGVDMSDVAQYNLDKLRSRQERGTLHGSGDKR